MDIRRRKMPGWELISEAMDKVYARYLQSNSGKVDAGSLKDQVMPRIYEGGLWPDDQTREEVLARFVDRAMRLCEPRNQWRYWMVEFILVQAGDNIKESRHWLDQKLAGSKWQLRVCKCARVICPGYVVATKEWFENPVEPCF